MRVFIWTAGTRGDVMWAIRDIPLAQNRPPERTVLVSQCVKDGNTEEACRCMADQAEATLDKEVLAAMALAAEGKDDEADEAMRKLTMEQQFSVAPFAAAAVEACNLS